MGYGSKAIDLLYKYYEGKMIDLSESNGKEQTDIELDRDENDVDLIGT